ncbi:hypothetical protein MAUB1S_03112 [Mycolicibacterium aubagnense]
MFDAGHGERLIAFVEACGAPLALVEAIRGEPASVHPEFALCTYHSPTSAVESGTGNSWADTAV